MLNLKLFQITARINRGKDISYKNIELTITADPLSYVAFGAMEYMLHDLGSRNGLTEAEVRFICFKLPEKNKTVMVVCILQKRDYIRPFNQNRNSSSKMLFYVL